MYFYGMYRVFLIFLLGMASSCAFFETERISSEEVLEEELKSFDWSDIDTYPSFPNCDGIMEKGEQRGCFETTILSSVQEQLALGKWVTSHPLNDTLFLHLRVDTAGTLTMEPVHLDSLVKVSLPKMDSLLEQGILQLPEMAPAYKRGIPVHSKFILPVVINTEEL